MGYIMFLVCVAVASTGIPGIYSDTVNGSCHDEPCKNGGSCIHSTTNDTFLCICPERFTGQLCEVTSDKNLTFPHNYSCHSCINDDNCTTEQTSHNTNMCLFGGKCTQITNTDSRCLCPSGISGQQCQQVQSVTFDGQGFIKLPPLPDLVMINDTMNISLTYSTSFEDGVIFFLSGFEDSEFYLSLEIIESVLQLSHNLGTKKTQIEIPLQCPIHGGIYTVTIEIIITMAETNATIYPNYCDQANRCHVTVKQTTGNILKLNKNFLIGGIDKFTTFIRSKLYSLSGFNGCLGNFIINGELLDLNIHTLNSSESSKKGVQYGCQKHNYCTKDFCQNGGKCMDLEDRKHCRCQNGYHGDKCEYQNEAHFFNGSLLHFDGTGEINELSMWITSTADNGMIAYTVGFDSVAIMLDKGKLRLHVLSFGTDEIISLIGNNLSDGNWFYISLVISSSKYTSQYKLQVLSNSSTSLGMTSGTIGSFLTIEMPIYFGNLHSHNAFAKWRHTETTLPTNSSFEGCIKNLSINGYKKDLSTHSMTKYGNDPSTPKPGCPRDDSCLSFPCLHGGVCEGDWQGYRCQCQSGFHGYNCSEVEPTTFNGRSSHVTVELNRTVFPFGDEGAFEFCTRQNTATLMLNQFYHHDNRILTSLEFRIQDEKLQIVVNYSSILTFPTSVSNGLWHHIEWHQMGGDMTVDLNGMSLTHPHLVDLFSIDQKSMITVLIGAKPFDRDTIYSVDFFHGCLKNLKFNNKLLNFIKGSSDTDGVTISLSDVKPGCHGDDVCKANQCLQNSFCNDNWNDYTCSCVEGWNGIFCNHSIDDCVNNLCSSGSTCLDGHLTYTCQCDHGKTGRFCEDFVFACDSNPCHTNNTEACIDVFPLHYRCHCKPGWTGKNCSENINECSSFPCLNHGHCTDLVDGFRCNCLPNFTGRNCHQRMLVCTGGRCFNGGTCSPNNDNFTYSCSCLPPYSGKQCQTFDTCFYHRCVNEAMCSVQKNSSLGYKCECKNGFHGRYCQFTDSCASQPCQNNGLCLNKEDSFQCRCKDHFSGDLCQIPVNHCNINYCSNNGICITNSSINSGFFCVCDEGYSGALCELKINGCETKPCVNGLCVNNITHFAGFTCDCFNGYYGDACQHELNECSIDTCLHNGTCVDLFNNYTCTCMEGFAGQNCENDLRGCVSSPCENSGVCEENFNKTFSCSCSAGFTGEFCETNIDDCENHQCKNGASCIDLISEYRCECMSGFDGVLCENVVNSCFSQPCFHGGDCIPKLSSELCFSQNQTCQQAKCSSHLGCHVNDSLYICNCTSTGYGGKLCLEDIDECQMGDICQNGGRCINTNGSYYCDCGYHGYQGQHCDIDIDECDEIPCYNDGKCINLPGSFKCDCLSGWSGQSCGENINDCTAISCLNGGVCNDIDNGFICNCTNTGYHGDDCSKYINHCESLPCKNGGRCYHDVNRYECDCSETGFKGGNCDVDVDECLSNPCRHNGSCINGVGRFDCHCDGTGHSGTMCEDDVNECQTGTHECLNHATCLNTYGSYYCSCLAPYTGIYCESSVQIIDQQSSPNQLSIIIPSVVIVTLLTVIGLFVLWYIKSNRKMHGQYKPSEEEEVVSPGIPLDKMLDITTGERLI